MPKQLDVTKSLELNELKNLANVNGPCLSLYVPLENGPNAARQENVRLKSVVRQAEEALRQRGVPAPEIRDITEPLNTIVSDVENGAVAQDSTLVVLRSPEIFRAFEVRQKLEESVNIGDHFHVLPIIPALQMQSLHFYVLALSLKHARLLRCTEYDAQEVPLPEGTPTGLVDWLNTRHPTKAPNHGDPHVPPIETPAGSFTSTQDRDKKDEHIANYYRVINKAVFEVLRDESAPLVLVGVEFELAMYAGINTYPHMVEGGVQGSSDSLVGTDLRERALEAVQQHFRHPLQKALATYEKLGGTDRVSTDDAKIVKAAFEGRIGQLFVAEGAHLMGNFDKASMQVRQDSQHEEDLVNAAAMQTFAHGGDVFVLNSEELPGNSPLTAILRF